MASRLTSTGWSNLWPSRIVQRSAFACFVACFVCFLLYRDDALAFAGDARALELARRAVDQGWVAGNGDLNHRRFYLMPMMHSEDLVVQRESIPLFSTHTDQNTLHFAQRHLAIIERFGRFPHRNQALGRKSSADELAFLAQPGSSF
uniref:DUF924 family protein n=1 Tax=Orrella sp. TaxID=1921583 RepID=UPI00404741EE